YHGQRVLLLLDNCTSHDITLQYTDVSFLPPNTTSKIQPMDVEIIVSFKRHYCCLHIRWMLQEIKNGKHAENLKMNVLQAIYFLIQSWDEVSTSTIRNYPVLNDILNALKTLNLPDSMPVEEFLAIPKKNVVYEVLSDDQVITDLVETFRADEPTTVELEDIDDSLEIPIVSANTANV
ncbi:12366_t:CDS:2, partial [Dentiscutata erythropus]